MVGSFFERAIPHSTGIIKSESSVCTKYLVGERNGREEREREKKREGWGEGRENASIRGHTVYTSLIHISEDGQLSCIQNSNTCSNRVAISRKRCYYVIHRWNSNIEPQGRYFIFHQQVFSNIAFLFASWCYVIACSVIRVEWFSQIRKLHSTSFKGTQ